MDGAQPCRRHGHGRCLVCNSALWRAVLPLADWWHKSSERPRLITLAGAAVCSSKGSAWPPWLASEEPERFFRALESHGLQLERWPCADHADHRELPFPPEAVEVIVTEKDAVKLEPDRLARERPGSCVWVAPLSLALPEALIDDIDTALKALRAENRPR